MNTDKILRMISEKELQMDVSSLLTTILCDNILNQKYLQAIAESQLYIM